jgi:uncharacterized membrane protein YidH (DUF202 family)
VTLLSSSERPVPPGTASERTRLSWTRTTLTLTAGGLTVTRLLWPHSAVLGLVVLVTSLAGAALLVALTAVRDRSQARDCARRPDGVLLGVVAAGTCFLGCAALALVAVR